MNTEHVQQLKAGVEKFNNWIKGNPDVVPDLFGANLTEANLTEANLTGANLTRATLTRAILCDANLEGAKITYRGKTVVIHFVPESCG